MGQGDPAWWAERRVQDETQGLEAWQQGLGVGEAADRERGALEVHQDAQRVIGLLLDGRRGGGAVGGGARAGAGGRQPERGV
ncbi:hypothetical protein B1218_34575 [Pseudomonas ogarae]|nr:hypothetical protein B1218_34575 [Pseudomonas ogarae]